MSIGMISTNLVQNRYRDRVYKRIIYLHVVSGSCAGASAVPDVEGSEINAGFRY